MLYVRNPTQREFTSLRQLRRHAAGAAQRARIVLLSAAGWSVPAIATALDCCRRSVRRWIHAFSRAGFAGLLGKVIGRPAVQVGAVSAIGFSTQPPVPSSRRMLPVVPLSVPEIRHLLNELVWNPLRSATFVLRWSTYRRYKQALAKRAHYRKRKSAPPEFQQLQL
jgi:hypothetical protein